MIETALLAALVFVPSLGTVTYLVLSQVLAYRLSKRGVDVSFPMVPVFGYLRDVYRAAPAEVQQDLAPLYRARRLCFELTLGLVALVMAMALVFSGVATRLR